MAALRADRAAHRDDRVLSFIYLPIVVLVIYAFNSSRIQTWPPRGFSLHWFAEARATRRSSRRSRTR